MRYSVLGGGKRMRPLLVYASGHLFGAQPEQLDAAAMSVELIHAYSLVHDDLPAMDDDALRRGKPTTHIAFDEATAILAGDALQTRAFGLLADAADGHAARGLPADPGPRVRCLRHVRRQALDIDATGQQQTLAALTRMHALKTGALIRAAVRMVRCAARPTNRSWPSSTVSPMHSAWPSRSAMTSWMWKPVLNNWARPPARTRHRKRAPSRRCWAWTAPAQLRELAARMQATLAGHGEEADCCARWQRWRWSAITDCWRRRCRTALTALGPARALNNNARQCRALHVSACGRTYLIRRSANG